MSTPLFRLSITDARIDRVGSRSQLRLIDFEDSLADSMTETTNHLFRGVVRCGCPVIVHGGSIP